MVSGTTGTFHRARLILSSAEVVPSVCTSTISYQWEDNGNNNAFTSTIVGGVTLSLSSTRDLSSDGADTAGRDNFTTQTGTFGNEAGYFIMQFDDGAVGAQSPEAVLLESSWSFDPPVRYQSWRHLDIDNGDWEDYVRIGATDGSTRVPYSLTLGSVHEIAGDIIETDGANVADDSTAGNVTYSFVNPVATLTAEYMRGDDDADPASQRIGIGSPSFCAFDYGDAPNSYGTQLAGGARHVLGTRSVWLGTARADGEANGTPNNPATGDDAATLGGVNDEDGTESGLFPACPNTGSYTMSVSASNQTSPASSASLIGYIDWNRDGDFDEANERSAAATVPEANADPASYNLTWSSVPANCGGTAATYARFRISTDLASIQSPVGQAPDGEVEDYQIGSATLPVTVAMVESRRQGDEIVVLWTTASETGNVGFRVWGDDASGRRQLLGTFKSQQADSFKPLYYQASVPGDGVHSIVIEDVSIVGETRLHGPFAVGSVYGEELEGLEIDWASTRAELESVGKDVRLGESASIGSSRRPLPSATRGALLSVREKGVHRVTYEQLLAAGVQLGGVQPDRIAVENEGAAYPRFIHAPGSAFGPGSYVEFYFDPSLTPQSPVDVLVLREAPSRALAAGTLRAIPGSLGVVDAEDRYEDQNSYSFASPTGDPWFEAQLLSWGGPASRIETFDLEDSVNGPVSITVRGWGYGDQLGISPDHHVVVSLNGVNVTEEWFDGIVPFEAEFDATELVTETGNQLEIRVPGDTGYPFDNFAFDGFSVEYARTTIAREVRFSGEVRAAGPVSIGGFSEGAEVAIWRVEAPGQFARGSQGAVGGAVSTLGGATIHAASAEAILVPGISPGVPTSYYSSRAEYVIVTHPAFVGSVADLVALQQAKGLSVEVVSVDRIYAAFSDHAPSSAAIREFLVGSLAHDLRYVLLAGSDTSDPYDHLGLGSVSFVPTDFVYLNPVVAFSPTDETLVDADGDGLGEVPIGRLPARTPSELQAMIDKIEQWESSVGTGRTATLTSGASDSGTFTLKNLNDAFVAELPGWFVSSASADELGTAATRTAILAALNGGEKLVSYVGHSSMGQWDRIPLLRWQDVDGLTNAGAPNLITAWGCWNSYFVEPNIESLAARLLREPDAGAAGAIGATTLTSEPSHQALGVLFFEQVNAGASRVGDALHAAKQALAAQGGSDDAILGMTLLGDPAMSLPVD
jgi:hypothetical protein